MQADKGTISIQLVSEAIYELQRGGADVRQLLEQAGIAPGLLAKPYARVSCEQYAQLWLALAQRTDDEFFGLNARRMKVGSFAFMARTASQEPTLERALQGALRFLGLIFEDLTPRLQRAGGMAEIVLEQAPGSVSTRGRAFADFTMWMIVHGLACWLVGRRIPIIAIEVQRPKPDYIEDYRVMFSENLRFNRPQSRLLFNAQWLDLPIRRSAEELKLFLRTAPQGILVKYRDPQSHAARIKTYLRAMKPERWPDIEAISAYFFMAPSTLRRKLSQEGQSYQSLKDHVRRDMAISRLDQGEINFNDLAFDLGFADASAFYKAFKKWTGSTPGQYHSMMYPQGSATVKTAQTD
ncbi:AraC family transcriptional regulator [Pseudomonas sp. M30-35]|nr:AraC family transcriptional regulator [Pseudomonas sp. M30-35]ARU88618.1 AraC family transcriptional regulator [Pseudomonas sp. M30-35]